MEVKRFLKQFFVVFALIFSGVLGLSACGDPHAGMKVLVESEAGLVYEDERYSASLVIELDENQTVLPESDFTFTAKVEGGASNISREINVTPSDFTKVSVISNVYNPETQTATITLRPLAKTDNDFETFVTVSSAETSDVYERIYLNIVLPATGISAKGDTNLGGLPNVDYYGVPAGQTVSLDPEDIFEFAPKNATVPNLMYNVDGVEYESLDEVIIPARDAAQDGMISISAYSVDDPENENMKATVYLRVYEPLNVEDFTVTRNDILSEESLTELELVKNIQGANTNLAVLALNIAHHDGDGVIYELECEEGILDEVLAVEPKGETTNGLYTIYGLDSYASGFTIKAKAKFANISNSPVIEKEIKVYVVDYPKYILLNNDYEQVLPNFNVYSYYTGSARGTELKIDLSPFSAGKGQFRLSVVYDGGDSYQTTDEVLSNVWIKDSEASDDQAFTLLNLEDEDKVFESGTTLIMRLIDGNIMGKVKIRVYSVAVEENELIEQKLYREFDLTLGRGVEDFELSQEVIDPNTNTVYLQLSKIKDADMQSKEPIVDERILSFTVTPSNANKTDVTVRSLDESIIEIVDGVDTMGNFTIRAKKAGVTQIELTAGSGYSKRFNVEVLDVLGDVALTVDVSTQSDRIAETSFDSKTIYQMAVNENGEIEYDDDGSVIHEEITVLTLNKIVGVKNKAITLNLQSYPQNAEIYDIEITSDYETIATAYAGGNNRIILNTRNPGIATLTFHIYYECLNAAGNALYRDYEGKPKYIELQLQVEVYEPVTELNLSDSYVELLIGENASYYDRQSGTTTVTATVNPLNSTTTAKDVVWNVLNVSNAASSYITISNGTETGISNIRGSTITITTTNRNISSSIVEAVVVATLQDRNSTFTQRVQVQIQRIVRINSVMVSNYDEDTGYYFEESKGFYDPTTNSTAQSSLIDVSVIGERGATPTNSNLAYFLFDAVVDESGNWSPIRDRTQDQAMGNYCNSALLRYNADEGKWQIEPKETGYAILYIVPQDRLTQSAESILDARLLDAFRNTSAFKELHITMSDGSLENRYRLYTAQDVLAMANGGGLDKHYYLMNSIDMSGVMAELKRNGQTWTPIGSEQQPFTGSITSWDNNGQIDDNASTLIISGWDFELNTQTSGSIFGIFGNVGQEGKIENVFFDINNITISHESAQDTYFYGALAGKMLGTVDNVQVAVRKVTITGNSSTELYVGAFGQTDSGREWVVLENDIEVVKSSYIDNLVVDFSDVEIEGTGSYSLAISFGGIAGINYGVLGNEDANISANVILNSLNVSASNSYYGGIVGTNYGQTKVDTSNNTYMWTSVAGVSSTGSISANSANSIGGIAGLNLGKLSYADSSVQLSDASYVGGVVGINRSAEILNFVSYNAYENTNKMPSLYRTDARSTPIIIGGLVGLLEITSDIAVEVGSMYNPNTLSGGIQNSYAKGFTDGTNISATGENVIIGGLVGRVRVSGKMLSYDNNPAVEQTAHLSIDACFSDLNIKANTTASTVSFVGGLVGDVGGTLRSHTLYISNSFTSGNVETLGLVSSHLIGQASITVGLSSIYSKAIHMVNGTQYFMAVTDIATNGSIVNGAYSSNINVVILSDTQPAENLKNSFVDYYFPKSQMTGNLLGYYGFDFASETARWLVADENTNDGFPVPCDSDGTSTYPLIPDTISLQAKSFAVYLNNGINNIINLEPGVNKIIIALGEGDNNYNLLDLFDAIIQPSTISANDLQVSVTSSNLSVLQPHTATYLSDWSFTVRSTGTATLTITALRNANATCTVQVCVINGFKNWGLYENADSNLNILENLPYDISLKIGTSLQMIVKYFNGQAGAGEQVQNVDAGIAFGVLDNTILDINGLSYSTLTYQGKQYYAVYADYASILSVSTLLKTNNLECVLIPYIVASFYDDNNQQYTSRVLLSDSNLVANVNFEVYEGATDIETTLAGNIEEPNSFDADQELTFDVVLTTDNEDEQQKGVAYNLQIFNGTDYNTDKNNNALWTSIASLLYDSESGDFVESVDGDYLNMFTYSLSTPLILNDNKSISQEVRFMFNIDFIRTMTQTYYFRWQFIGHYGGYTDCSYCENGIINTTDQTGQVTGQTVCYECYGQGSVANVSKTVYFKVLPQGVTRIDIAHFSDAQVSNNYIVNAGEKPNNSIIAGEYGLLRITISPEYAYYDEIQVYSSTAEGDVISFDQRVAYETVDSNGARQVQYHSYQAGVSVLPNGISLAKVSNKYVVSIDEETGEESYEYNFDGNIYLRTLIANYVTTAASFNVTVVILREGQVIYQTNPFEISVEKISDLSVGFYSFNSAKNYAYIAAGTGGSSQQNIYNQNEFLVNVSGEFDRVRVDKSSDEIEDLSFITIEQVGNRYYIRLSDASANYIGKTFRITAYGTKNVNGYTREIPRSMNFTIVNFVVMGLTVDNVSNGVYSQVFVTGKEYDLRVVTDFSKISSSALFEDDVNEFFAKLNGIGPTNEIIQAWYYKDTSSAAGVYKKTGYYNTYEGGVIPTCNDAFYIAYHGLDDATEETPYANVYKIAPLKYGANQELQLLVSYCYENGKLTYTEEPDNIVFTQQFDVTVNFMQRSSIDHPVPIYTTAEFLNNMQAGGNYILMNDLDFSVTSDVVTSVNWKPFTTAIASLDGNGRTITIQNIYTDSTSSNIGFFDTIAEGTVIKNLNIKVLRNTSDGLVFNLNENEEFNFGLFAAVNRGTITNCSIIGASSRRSASTDNINININSQANATNNNLQNIAGFVASNEGQISNSRVERISLTVLWGNLAGFVASNSGTISSSYFKGDSNLDADTVSGTLRNRANVPAEDYVSTSGFVGFNSGRVFTSYTGGTFTTVDASGNISLATTAEQSRSRDGRIYANYYISGFVFDNSGEISDCYSALFISGSNYSSGFVFKNGAMGTIKRAYSTSLLQSSSRSQTPFIGTTAMGTNVQNNNENTNEDAIDACFFYDFGCPDEALLAEVATALTEKQFINQDGAELSAWQDYAVSRMTNEKDGFEYTGIWTFVQPNNEYFNTNRFDTNFGPKLVSADVISSAGDGLFMNLDTENTRFDEEANETVYAYTYAVPNYIATDGTTTDGVPNFVFTPFVITSSYQLNELLVNNEKSNVTNDTNNFNKSWYRLACDIDLGEIKEGSEGFINTITTIFAGNFDGNGFNITIPDIVSETQTGQTGESEIENVGFVSEIITSSLSRGTMKSLELTVDDLSAGLITNVGALAGKIDNGYVSNITISSVQNNESTITGGNNVGALAGKVMGTSRVINVETDISVTATFGSPTNVDPEGDVKGLMYNADLLRLVNDKNAIGNTLEDSVDNNGNSYYNPDTKVSYVGGVIGVADLIPFDGARNTDSFSLNSSLISGVKVVGDNSVVGVNTGGVIGLIGASSVVNFAEKEITENSMIKSTGFAGGLVGENHGYLRYSQVYYEDSLQTVADAAVIGELPTDIDFNLFTGNATAIGGLVGFNYGITFEDLQTGYIYSSNSRIRVSSSSAQVAGGLVGLSVGGNMKTLFTSGGVSADQGAVIGGAFGYVGTLTSAISNEWNLFQNPFGKVVDNIEELEYDNISNQALTVSYIVSQNNWAANDYFRLINVEEYGGYLGGFAGFVSNNGSALAVIHKSSNPETEEELDVAPDPIYNSSETNFYVTTIYSSSIPKTIIEANNLPVSVSGSIQVTELKIIGNMTNEESESHDFAKGLIRNYMASQDGKKRMFANWAFYSFNKDENGEFVYDEYGSPEFDRETVPDIIQITNLGQIRNIMAYELDKHYILMNDIDCFGGTFIIGDSNTNCFSGEFDGQGNVIYNFTANTSTDHVAFFGVTKNAYIHDVKFFNMQITSYSINPTSTAAFVVGKATDTVLEKVNVIEEYNGEKIQSNLTSSAAFTGGLVGYVISDELANVHNREIDYNNGTIGGYYANNLYYLCFVTGNINVQNVPTDFGASVGGLFGEIKGQDEGNFSMIVDSVSGINNTVVVDKSAFVGNIEINNVDAKRGDYDITIGGFAGKASNSTILQSYTKADVTGENLSGDLYAGGFVGYLEYGVTYKTLAYVDVTIHTNNNNNEINGSGTNFVTIDVGGYAGYTSGYTWTASVITNIVFTSDNEWTTTAQEQIYASNASSRHQNIGGFAGALWFDTSFVVAGGSGNIYQSLKNILVLNSTYNYTTLARVDSFVFELLSGSISGTMTNRFQYLTYEEYYSLTPSNRLSNYGVQGASRDLTTASWQGAQLVQVGVADADGNQERYFYDNVPSDRSYPVMQFVGLTDDEFADQTDLTNSLFIQYYDTFSGYANTENGSKIKPIILSGSLPVNDGVTEGQQDYKYYFQDAQVTFIPTEPLDFYGFYNNSGQNVEQNESYDFLFGEPDPTHFSYSTKIGAFNNLLNESTSVTKPYGSSLSGMTMNNVKISFTSNAASDISYGMIVCGDVQANSVVYGAQTNGFMEITKNDNNAVLAGIIANNYGQLIASTSSIDYVINGNSNFVLGGLVANQNSDKQYGISDCYFGGSLTINSNNIIAGGVVGYTDKLYARNTYTYGGITNTGTSDFVDSFVGQIYDIASCSCELSFERSTSKTDSVMQKIMAFYTIDAYNTNFYRYFSYDAWDRKVYANYGYPYLSCIQTDARDNPEESQVYISGDGSLDSPYLIQNEGQLVWALTNTSSNYYKLERDMDYAIIAENYNMQNILPSNVNFIGNLDGAGRSILNSTDILVNSINQNASVTALGFENVVGTNRTLLANTVNGEVSSAYLNDSNASNKLVQTVSASGVMKDCLTEGATLTISGSYQNCYRPEELATLGLDNYQACIQNTEGMDFFETWIFVPSNASATATIDTITGSPMLRSFIETWDEKDLSSYSSNENFKKATVNIDAVSGTTYIDVNVDSVEELIRISQYIARNAGINTIYTLNFNKDNDYNFQGLRVNPIGMGRSANLNFVINGNGATFYNLVLDDLNVSNSTGLFGKLNLLSTVENLNFNNVSLKTKIYGGVLAGVNAGSVDSVAVQNSWLIGADGLVDDPRAILGGMIGQNLGSISASSVTNLIIDSHAASVGGLIGEYVYNKDNEQVLVTDNSVNYTKINTNLNSSNTTAEQLVNIKDIGGFVGKYDTTGSIEQTTLKFTYSRVYSSEVVGFENVGGFVGYNNGVVGSLEITRQGNGEFTKVVGTDLGYGSDEIVSNSIGGLAGYNIVNITNSTVNANIDAPNSNYVGGFVGQYVGRNQATILSSSTVSGGTITGNNNVGGFVGYSINGKIGEDGQVNTINALNITGNTNVGGIVGENGVVNTSGDALAGNYSQIYWNDLGTDLNAVNINGNTNVGGLAGISHNNIESYATGKNNLVNINITATGNNIGGLVGLTDKNVGAINNITMNGVSISLNGENQAYAGGFVGSLNSATSLTLVTANNISISASNKVTNIGGAVGLNEGSIGQVSGTQVQINNVSVTVENTSENIGGLIGVNSGQITGITSIGVTVSGGITNIGGFVGYNNNQIGTYDSTRYDANYKSVQVTNVTMTNLNENAEQIGGFVGLNDSAGVVECAYIFNNRVGQGLSIQGKTKLGGFVGWNKGRVGTLYNVTNDIYVNDASVIGQTYVGGFAGLNDGIVQASTARQVGANLSNITATGDKSNTYNQEVNVGGFAGYNSTNAEIINSYSLVGRVSAVFDNGGISYYQSNVGGFIGLNDGEIKNSHVSEINSDSGAVTANVSSVDGFENVGGFVGKNTGTITTYQVGQSNALVTGQGLVGGIVGFNDGGFVGGADLGGGEYANGYTNYGQVTGRMRINDSSIAYATYYNTASSQTISAYNTYFSSYAIGGIVGYNYCGTITSMKNYSNVIGGTLVGGIAGVNEGTSGSQARLIDVFAYNKDRNDQDVTVQIAGARFIRNAPNNIYVPEFLKQDRTPSLFVSSRYENYILAQGNNEIDGDMNSFGYNVQTYKIGAGRLVGIQNNYGDLTYYGNLGSNGLTAMISVQSDNITTYTGKRGVMCGGIAGNTGSDFEGYNGNIDCIGGIPVII